MTLYGFHNLKDLGDARVTGSLVEAVNDAITASVTEYNRAINATLGLFVTRTTQYTERYAQIGAARLQPLDDDGRALPIKPSGYYSVGYPIQSGGSAWGANYVTRAKMTVADAERATALMIGADTRWMRDHILASLFASASWSFTDDLYGAITVQPLASGDAVTYGLTSGEAAADTHQLAQANAIGAGADNPFPIIYSELMEHPENQGEVVVFISSSLKATTTALATFNPVGDANITPGNASDRLTASLDVAVPGTLLGYEDAKTWIVEWPSLPAGYMVAVATEGNRALAMREDPETELQGFNKVADRDDHPFYESQWLRRAGFGARNRVGAVVYRVGNGTYAVPTGYSVPMA